MVILKKQELLLAEKFFQKGKYEDVIQFINDIEQKEKLSSVEKLTFNLLKGSAMVMLGQYDETFSLAEQLIQESQKLGKKLHTIDALILKAKSLYWLRKIDDGLKIIEQGERLLKTITDKSSFEIKQRKAWIAWGKGVSYMEKGEYDLQLKNLEKGLKLGEETGIKQIAFFCLMLLGNYYTYVKGDFNRALRYLNRSLEVARSMQNQLNTAWSISILVSIYYKRGELDICVKYIKQAYSLFKKTNNKIHGTSMLNYLGAIYLDKGEFSRASRYLERTFAIYEKIGDSNRICIVLTDLIFLALEKSDFELSNFYFNYLKRLNKKENNIKFVSLEYKFNKAMIFKKDPQQINLSKAKALLEQIINEESVDLSLYTLALLELCDILIINLKATNDLKLIDVIRPILNKVIEITKKTQSYWLLTETYLLQAKLELVTLDLNEAQLSLDKAYQTAEKFGLKLLILRILDEKDELEKQFTLWENFKSSQAIIAERIYLAHIDNQLVRMLRKRLSLEKIVFN